MEKPYVIGMDMGGTNTVFGVVDARGNVISKSAIKTGTHSDVNLYINVSCVVVTVRSPNTNSFKFTNTTCDIDQF